MTLDPSARQANILDSLKKYFTDSLFTTEGVKVNFDKALSDPAILTDKSVDRWVTFVLGNMDPDILTDVMLSIYCCTRKDNEGFKLSQLRDKTMGYLTGDPSGYDATCRIPFYQSSATGSWTLLGAMVVTSIIESGILDAPDETKYKVLTIRLKVPSKL